MSTLQQPNALQLRGLFWEPTEARQPDAFLKTSFMGLVQSRGLFCGPIEARQPNALFSNASCMGLVQQRSFFCKPMTKCLINLCMKQSVRGGASSGGRLKLDSLMFFKTSFTGLLQRRGVFWEPKAWSAAGVLLSGACSTVVPLLGAV